MQLAKTLCALTASVMLTACGGDDDDANSNTDTARPIQITIWPNGVAPGSEAVTVQQAVVERSTVVGVTDRAVTGVTRPALTFYKAARPNGSAVLIAPGGAYVRVVIDKEGADVATPYNAAGISVFVLTYRLPGDGHVDAKNAPLADAQRAIRVIRANAAQWGIDPDRIGVMGFSAGGHVAASLATKFDHQVYAAQDAVDSLSARPAFAVLLYPVITMDLTHGHAGSRQALLGSSPSSQNLFDYSLENKVRTDMPPTFVALAADDASVEPAYNGELFASKVSAVGVNSELHVFPLSGHGFGIRAAVGDATTWPQLSLDWLRARGM
ncbi:MAG: alpha/beta hydrolase [Rhodocyclaceae bacterium]